MVFWECVVWGLSALLDKATFKTMVQHFCAERPVNKDDEADKSDKRPKSATGGDLEQSIEKSHFGGKKSF